MSLLFIVLFEKDEDVVDRLHHTLLYFSDQAADIRNKPQGYAVGVNAAVDLIIPGCAFMQVMKISKFGYVEIRSYVCRTCLITVKR